MKEELPTDIRPCGRYNKSQTARILGISRTSLDKYIVQGMITPILWNGKLYFKGLSIIKFFNS